MQTVQTSIFSLINFEKEKVLFSTGETCLSKGALRTLSYTTRGALDVPGQARCQVTMELLCKEKTIYDDDE